MITLWPNGRLRLIVTGVCNARCPHCHNEGVERESCFIDSRIVSLFASIASERNDPLDTVTFTGGEPLLHPEIVELCAMISSSTHGITIPTNGFRLTDSRIRDLGLAGVSRIRIDIDPWRFERARDQDNNLNTPEIMERVNNIRHAGISAALNTVLTRYSIQQLRELLLLCAEHHIPIKIFERTTRETSSGRFVADPDVPFTILYNVIHELFPLASYTSYRGVLGDVEWHDLPFPLRYCRILCATKACKMSGLRCAPDGRISVCVNQFGPEMIGALDNADSAVAKIAKVIGRTCVM